MVVRIAVIGAGVNGLACAVKIKEKYKDSYVVVISNEFSPNTTSDGSGGLWYPYLCGNTPDHLLYKWGGETYAFLHQLWREGVHGVCLVPLWQFTRDARCRQAPWASFVFGYRALTGDVLRYANEMYSAEYRGGHTFTTFVSPPPNILRYLYKRFTESNGEVLRATVNTLQDPILSEFDVVINCTGLNAKTLVPDDHVFPIRGQISRVTAPWINETILDEENGHYIIPNLNFCVLGGTHQENDYNTRVTRRDASYIRDGCTNIIPSLKNASVQEQWVGLRPGRREVRLQAETKDGRLVIHNYGHGGSGLTLFWGCASDVLQLLDNHLTRKSKL